MDFIDSSGSNTTTLADAVAISLDGTTFISSSLVDISGGSYMYGVCIFLDVVNGGRNAGINYTTDGGVTWNTR